MRAEAQLPSVVYMTDTSIQDPPGLAEMKQRTRATWAAGDFPSIARRALWPVGERLVRRVGIGRDEDVLDVACGTGKAAIRAAQAGGRVTGTDLTPELFDAARREADAAGVSVDWVEGDAEALPFADAGFDVVLSTFGVMFAPRHAVAAAELARVLRPGGRLALCNWTPEGAQGELFRALADFAPGPPPPFAQPPLLWGSEQHVRDLFAGTGIDLEFERDAVQAAPFPSAEESFEWGATSFGPLVMMRPILEQQGRWDELRERMLPFLERNEAAEYLVVLGRKRG
jgi:SAM-dependent methyltransferase